MSFIVIRYIVKEVGSKIGHLTNLSSITDLYFFFFFFFFFTAGDLSIGFFFKKANLLKFLSQMRLAGFIDSYYRVIALISVNIASCCNIEGRELVSVR